jgi:hypothetical protein
MIRIPETPAMQQNAIGMPFADAGAASAPARALGPLAQGLASLGEHFQGTALKAQAIENARVESEARQKLAGDYSAFQIELQKEQDPAARIAKTQTFLANAQNSLVSADMPPAVRDRLGLHAAEFVSRATIAAGEDAARLAEKRAEQAFANEIEAAPDMGSAMGVLGRMRETGAKTPEEMDAIERKVAYQFKYRAIQSMIQSNPLESETELQTPDFLERHPELTPEAIQSLRRQSAQSANASRADLWDNVLSASLDGKILSADELKTLDNNGTITPQQRASYLSAYHRADAPAFDDGIYADAWGAVQSYDPADDPTGSHLAQLRGQLATLDLPKDSVATLRGQLNERLQTPAAPKHRLSGDYAKLTGEYFDQGRFGGWFSMQDHDSNPATADLKVISAGDFAKALGTQRRFLDQWNDFLKTAPADLAPEAAQKSYDAIFKSVVLDNTPIDIGVKAAGPPPPAFNDRVSKALGESPKALASAAASAEPVGLSKALAPLAPAFAEAGRVYGVDPRLLAAISIHETGNGTSHAFRTKKNAMGVSDSSGPVSFTKPEVSIMKMAKLLGSGRGPYAKAATLAEVAGIYAPIGAGNDARGLNKDWLNGVKHNWEALGGDPSKPFRFEAQPLAVPKTATRTQARDLYFSEVAPTRISQVHAGLAAVDEDYYDSLLETEDAPE